jgi:hypothetical protein
MPTFAFAAVLAVSFPAAGQPAPAAPATGHVTAVTLAATTPVTFRGVCSPSVYVAFEGKITTDAPQPIAKGLEKPGKFIWSDYKVDPVNVASRSSDRKLSTVTQYRYFNANFDGWVKLQAQPWPDVRPRESSPVAVKITCEPPVFKQLQNAPAGSSKVPTPGH